MSISAQEVKRLREMTGVGMMDCKEALTETAGDFDKAVEFLRKKGLSKAAKKADRETKEGLVHAQIVAGKTGAMLELNCETDFVARGTDFVAMVEGLTGQMAAAAPGSPVSAAWLLEQPFFGDKAATVQAGLAALIAKLGENMKLARAVRYDLQGHGLVYAYIHPGARVGVLIETRCAKGETAARAEFVQVTRDMAMQVAAAQPRFVGRAEADQAEIEKEKEIFRAQMESSGKPAQVIEKIVEGKIDKFFNETCLLEQPFIKDQDRKVSDLLAAVGKELGDTIGVARFTRYALGEGA